MNLNHLRRAWRLRILALLIAASTLSVVGWASTAQAASPAKVAQVAVAADDATVTPVAATPDAVSGNGAVPDAMSQCDLYNFCLWQNANFGGTFFCEADFFANPHDQWFPVCPQLNAAASSLWNNRDGSTDISDWHGHQACIPAHKSYANLTQWYWPGTNLTMNDSIRYVDFTSTSLC